MKELRSLRQMYARYYRGQMHLVTLSLSGSLLRSLLAIPIALLTRQAVDKGFRSGTPGSLALIAAGMAALYLVGAALSIAVQRVSTRASTNATSTLRKELAARLHRLPRSFVTAQPPAEIQSIIVSDTSRVADFSSSMINGLIPSIVTVVALSVYLFILSPRLGLIMAITAPIAMVVNHVLRARVEKQAREYRMSYWRFNGAIHRAVRIWDLTSSHNAASHELQIASKHIDEVSAATFAQQTVQMLYAQIQSLSVSLAGILVLFVGGVEVQAGRMTIGTFLSFFVVMALAQSSTQSLLGALPGVLIGREALLALQAWNDSAELPPYGGSAQPALAGNVTFERVSFAYGDVRVLDDVSVTIEAGSIVALVGPNGAGKTTMMNLLMGWYRPSQGRLLADDIPFDELSMEAWRDSIAIVHQDPSFLGATVRENICYGRPETTDEQVWAAARIATADDVIRGLPEGLDTEIGEGGVRLSGGQRQRLALTRALVREPRVLVMDEPTNHLDRLAVRRLLDRMKQLPYLPTVIVITHDADVVEIATQTLHLDRGRVVDRTKEAISA